MSRTIGRRAYAELYGPTVGDRVRLADTGLIVEVEKDYTLKAGGYGEEVKFGSGKTIRDGMGQSQVVNGPGHHEAHDLVITNALIIDTWGIVKADIGIKGCRIAAIGKAGNPDVQPGVDIIIGPGTQIMAGEGLIVTAGGIDSHSHFICPQQIEEAQLSGITTMLGGGTGPATGTMAAACTPGPENLHRMLQAAEAFSMNLGFRGKGNTSQAQALSQQIAAGAMGLTLHEDWGSTPAAIDNCLTMADVTDTQVSLHSDTLNEGGFIEDTISATRGRTLCAVHTEGSSAGHASDNLLVVGEANFLPNSTCSTLPYTFNTVDEQQGKPMARYHLDASMAEGGAFAESRIRRETVAAEDVLHDLGAISMVSSGGQAMGRVGEVIIRTWQTAHKMKGQRGCLPEDNARNDNFRVKRYIAKYTINPAIATGISHDVGSVEVGKWADLVIWRPAFFGVKPSLVIKGGFIAAASVGDANASVPAPLPVHHRPMFGSFGRVVQATSLTFISQTAMNNDLGDELGLRKRLSAVHGCRGIKKGDMVLNGHLPKIEIDPQTYRVRADGQVLTCDPATVLPMAQKYFLF